MYIFFVYILCVCTLMDGWMDGYGKIEIWIWINRDIVINSRSINTKSEICPVSPSCHIKVTKHVMDGLSIDQSCYIISLNSMGYHESMRCRQIDSEFI